MFLPCDSPINGISATKKSYIWSFCVGKVFQKNVPCLLPKALWSPMIRCLPSLATLRGVPSLPGKWMETSAARSPVGNEFHIETFAFPVAVTTSFSPSVQTAQGHPVSSFHSKSAGCPFFVGKKFHIKTLWLYVSATTSLPPAVATPTGQFNLSSDEPGLLEVKSFWPKTKSGAVLPVGRLFQISTRLLFLSAKIRRVPSLATF